MIKPTVGGMVHFLTKFEPDEPEQPLAAIVTFVHTDRLVNLCVFDMRGDPRPKVLIPLRQPGEVAPSGEFCEWVDYQVDQTAKTDALQPRLDQAA